MKKIDIKIAKEILSYEYLIKYVKASITLLTIFLAIELTTLYYTYDNILKNYDNKIETSIKTDGVDISVMCNIVSCTRVSKGNGVYENIDGFLKRTIIPLPSAVYLGIFTEDFQTIYKYKDYKFLIDNQDFIELSKILITINGMIFLLIFNIIYTKYIYDHLVNKKFEKNILKLELEDKLQRDISESAHHEMGQPVALVKVLIKSIFQSIYKCNGIGKKGCENCIINIANNSEDSIISNTEKICKKDKDIFTKFNKIMYALDRIDAVLQQMSSNKYIKQNNGNIGIYDIISNIVSGINSAKVFKIEAEFEREELLKKYATGIGMNNGDMLNIINNHVTNSLDAKATKILFKPNIISETKMELYIADNGIGIRDKHTGEIIKTTEIFNLGYSTKDKDGNPIIERSYFKRILYRLGIIEEESGTRGIGLYINRGILNRSNGDLKLITTSESGTVFKLTLPIKERKDE